MACSSTVQEQKWYAIREVSELTGVKPVTLRAWQRRYNLIKPHRTEKGHRLYSEANIEHIRLIQSWLAKGVAIGKVRALLESPSEQAKVIEAPNQLAEVDELLDSLARLQRGKAEAVIARTFKEYPIDIAEAAFVQPIQTALSHMSKAQRSLQTGLFQSLMMAKLSAILEAENRAAHKGHCLLVNHEDSGHIGAWIWAIQLAGQGLKVTVLDGVADFRGLVDHLGLTDYQQLAIYANHSLVATQRKALETLAHSLQVRCSPVLEQLLVQGEDQ
ncbi:DNA-binding transcriptional regulator, MerR family [Vibrio xiamenensis]|uniref:DNA-binding transcriptional regulator, MerR family n=1 Tax=Vibrio xiamenensis TaxID=861298 RepID=A0A1G8AFZ5_9VIBR|nr:MerR family transcriptional regulator [Vibrio xiamenensis]SDH19894.1 DNA-binding transcriptional regulator, MerR family [Vibrio xiamenensis]